MTGFLDDMVYVNVFMENGSTSVDAFTYDLMFDSDMLEYIGCEVGQLDPEWYMFGCNDSPPITPTPGVGVIRTVAFTLFAEIPVGSLGSLVSYSFRVTCGGCTHGDRSELQLDRLVDDIQRFSASDGSFMFLDPSLPTPTPSPTPPPIPATDPAGLSILLLLISGLIVLGTFRHRH